MNLFILDKNPEWAAAAHCDKHVCKMILESAQLLSTAHVLLDGQRRARRHIPLIVKPYSPNHPCALWVRQSNSNYAWARTLLAALLEQFELRFKKPHQYVELADQLLNPPDAMKSAPLSPFFQCVPEQFRQVDAVQAYRAYYWAEKRYFARWSKPCEPPHWWKTLQAADTNRQGDFNHVVA